MVSMISGNKSSTLGLMNAFNSEANTPRKSSLSERRQSVSFQFFKDIFDSEVKNFKTEIPTWKGLYVTATDGDNYSLPASEDVLESGYLGSPVKGERETYYPRICLLYTSPSPRDQRGSRMPSSA